MPIEPTENKDEKTKTDTDSDLENCRGQCGYTPWCKDCKTPETFQKQGNDPKADG
jgi:hypothetical protein